tara:strand:+ start:437 stop:1021 length:585 start_codon:yes stop_codon:yes gene_type:complete
MIELHTVFPVTIAAIKNKNHKIFQNNLIKECKKIKKQIKKGGNNWSVSTFNTCGSYNLTKNKNFKNLHDWIFKQVTKYAHQIGYENCKIKCLDSWFNIYNKYEYQERHEHLPNDISAVYYLKTPEKSGNIRFYSHEPSGVKYCYVKNNPLTWKTYWIKSEEGLLLIFKSNLMHEVEQNKSSQQKISMALNFKVL